MSQSHLVIDFPIKGAANAKALPGELPPLMPDLAAAQDDLGTVHFSRFMVVGDEKLLFLSDIDGETDEHIERLVERAGPVFDAIFTHVDNPPPTPVADNPEQVIKWLKRHVREPIDTYFAYEDASVQDIKACARAAGFTGNTSQGTLLTYMSFKSRVQGFALKHLAGALIADKAHKVRINSVQPGAGSPNWPPCLGLFKSVAATLTYMRHNRTQAEIGESLSVSQPTISRAISAITPLIQEATREFVPTADDLDPDAQYILDGTLLPCWSWDGHKELYSGKHKTTGMNVQVACTIYGKLAWISNPVNGSRHDNYCREESAVLLTMNPKNWIGDKGYIGNNMITPFRKPAGGELLDWQKEYNSEVNKIRWMIEQVISHFKNWTIIRADPQASDSIGTLHVAHFVPFEHNHVGFFTVYDGDMEKYFQDFADKTAFTFNALFPRVVGGAPTPVEKNAHAFYQWGLDNNYPPIGFYSAYPGFSVQDIRALLADYGKSPSATAE